MNLLEKILKIALMSLVGIGLLTLSSHIATYNSETYIRSKVIQLEGNNHACSGTQIKAPSGKDYILTAGHCLALSENGIIYAKDDLHQLIPRRVIQEDVNSDLLLIEGLPGLS